MGFLSRLAGAFRPPVETRASAFYSPTIAGWGPSVSGASVDPALAESLATVCACVSAISSGLTSLPARVYRTEGAGRVEVPNHPVAGLIRRPNPYQTWSDLIENLMGSVLLWGNALAVIDHDAAGQPTALTPVPWQSVQVSMLPSGQLAYDIVSYSTPWGGSGTPRRFLAGDCLHIKDRGDNPYVGRSRISRAAPVVDAAVGLATYSTAIARQIEALSREFFTMGNRRKNALGEGFEDLVYLLLQRISKIPSERIALRKPVSELPGFRRGPPRRAGNRAERQPRPDLAIVEGGVTHVITTAKWSMRQDRETQFQSEYTAYQMNKIQPAELRYTLITNEVDTARLNSVARAIPGGAGGYIFHNIYHINPELLMHAQGERIGAVAHWIGAGKISSLADFLKEMRERFGSE